MGLPACSCKLCLGIFLRVRKTFGTLWAGSHRSKVVLYFLLNWVYGRRSKKSLKVCGAVRVACSDFVSRCERISAVVVDFPSYLFSSVLPAATSAHNSTGSVRSSGRNSSLVKPPSTFTVNDLCLNLIDALPTAW